MLTEPRFRPFGEDDPAWKGHRLFLDTYSGQLVCVHEGCGLGRTIRESLTPDEES